MKYYVPYLNELVQIKFFVAYFIQDRVEHCEFTGFSGHNGVCSTIPGLSCPIKIDDVSSSNDGIKIVKQIHSCKTCYALRFLNYSQELYGQASVSNITCPKCYDWDLGRVEYYPHEDYPEEMIPDKERGVLTSKQITFQSMIDACRIMFEQIYLHKWTQNVMLRYAQVECIKRSVAMSIYKYAKSIRSRNKKLAQRPVPPLPLSLLPSGMTQQLFTLEQCFVGVMHTLILNLGKHMLLSTVRVLGNDWSKYYKKSNHVLTVINKLSISWCKCFYYGSLKNPGSMWVSENYLAFGFVCKSMYSLLYELDKEYHLLFDVFLSYNAMISHVMQNNIPTTQVCDKVAAISRIFLSMFNVLDRSHTSDSQSKIETASCVISVLTIAEQMRTKGMQRNYWEGGWFGEGFFRCIKPLIQRGTHMMGVFVGTMKKIYRIRCINEMINKNMNIGDNGISETINIDTSNSDLFDVSRYRKFHTYKQFNEVNDSIQKRDPLATFYHRPNHKFYIAVKSNKTKVLHELQLYDFEDCFNTSNYNVTLGNVTSGKKIEEISLNSTEYSSVLLLPLCNKEKIIKYYCISDEHKEYVGNGKWKLPEIHLDSEVFSTVNNNAISDNFLNQLQVWDSIEKLNEIVGSHVVPINNSTSGKITHCYFANNEKCEDNARWSVSYYLGEEIEENIVSKIVYNCQDICDIMLM